MSETKKKLQELREAFSLGLEEAGSAFGMTYDGDPESPRSVAYDSGRNVGEALLKEDE